MRRTLTTSLPGTKESPATQNYAQRTEDQALLPPRTATIGASSPSTASLAAIDPPVYRNTTVGNAAGKPFRQFAHGAQHALRAAIRSATTVPSGLNCGCGCGNAAVN